MKLNLDKVVITLKAMREYLLPIVKITSYFKNINTKEAEQIISKFNKSNLDQANTKKTQSPDKNKVKSKKISKK